MTARTRAALLVAFAAPAALVLAAPPAAAADEATVSVLHAIPAGAGADVVDVYAGDSLLIDNFTPGTLKTLQVPAGSYDLAVFADGDSPGSGTAVLSAPGTEVPAGANATVTANLTADGDPALNVFVNDTSKVPAGQGRLVVRHIAAAPAVDVRANGDVLFADLTNPNEDSAEVPAATYEADVVLAGTDTVALGPADVPITEGTTTIVYAWGSAEGDSLALATQVVEAHSGTPGSVPAGDGSSIPAGVPGWALALGALAALGVAASTIRIASSKS
jgi:hypothetical protein